MLATVVTTAVASGAMHYGGVPGLAVFPVVTVALAGLAWLVAFGTDALGHHFGPGVTGLLQSMLGNLPELFVVIFALRAGEIVVARTSILGSLFANALLVLGLVIIVGARHSPDGVMRFSRRLPNDTATLLLLTVFIIVLLGLSVLVGDRAASHQLVISTAGAIVLLCVYFTWVWSYVRAETRESPGDRVQVEHNAPALTMRAVLGIAGNAVENFAGLSLAANGKMDDAISVAKNSVTQIAVFPFPVLVLVSLLFAQHLTLVLAPVYVGALMITAIAVWPVSGDGEATIPEGAALIGILRDPRLPDLLRVAASATRRGRRMPFRHRCGLSDDLTAARDAHGTRDGGFSPRSGSASRWRWNR